MSLTTKYGVTFIDPDGSEDAWGEYGSQTLARVEANAARRDAERRGRKVAVTRNEYDGEVRVDSEFLDVYAD